MKNNMLEKLRRAGFDVTDLESALLIRLPEESLTSFATAVLELAKEETPQWTALIRYDRGLGTEFLHFDFPCADLALAHWEGEKRATKHFGENDSFAKAVIKEIRIRPYVTTGRKG